MKILRIRLKNIHSLKGEHEIDFTVPPLSETGIFAITGPTGAGKSSILDTISLALFNKIPRLNSDSSKTISKNIIEENNAIITRGETESYAEVEYESNGKTFRSQWSVSTARTGKLRDYEMKIAQLPSEKIFDLKKSEVPAKNEELIGLNYSQFVKSSLLSQGEFARFIKSSQHERGELLERITGTEIYRHIGAATFERFKQEETKLKNIEIQLNNIQLISEEELENIRTKISTNKNELNQLLSQQKDLKSTENKLIQYNLLKEALKTLENNFSQIEKTKTDLKEDFIRLEKHLKTQILIPDINEYRRLEEDYKNINEKQVKANETLDNYSESIIILKKEIKELKETIELKTTHFELLKPKIEEALITQNEINSVNKELKEIEKAIQLLDIKLKNKELEKENLHKDIQNNKNKIQENEIWIADNKIASTLKSELPMLKNAFTNWQQTSKLIEKEKTKLSEFEITFNPLKNNLLVNEIKLLISNNQKSIKNLESEIPSEYKEDTINEEIEKLLKEFSKIEQYKNWLSRLETTENQILEAKNRINSGLKEEQKFSVEKDKIQNETQILSKHIDELEIRKERLALEEKFSDQRKKLSENTECPLCGSTHHPYVKNYVTKSNETDEKLSHLKTKLKQYEKDLKAIEISISKNKLTEENEKEKIKNIEIENTEIKKLISKLEPKIQAIKRENIDTELQNITKTGKQLRKFANHFKKIKTLKDKNIYLNFTFEKAVNAANSFTILSNYLEPFAFYTKLHKGIEEKIASISKLYEQFETKKNEKEIAENKNIIIGKEMESIVGQIRDFEIEKRKLLENATSLNSNLKILESKRYETIKDKNPLEYQNRHQKEIENIKNQYFEKENLFTKLNTSAQETQLQISEIEKNRNIIKLQYNDKVKVLEQKLSTQNYSSIEALEKDILDDKIAENIRLKKEQINKEAIEINVKLNEKKAELSTFSSEEMNALNIEEIQNKIIEIDAKTKEINEINGAFKQQIKTNKEQNEKAKLQKEKMSKQRKEFSIWEKLNQLIGDKEGKKYRQFAQEYTLKQLITLANKHITHFSDRYVILPSDSLSKDIIISDSYQGDATRSVSTLSGGETFIVSLSLALALADLAGNKTKIESLFIDEGFGSLDQNTLDLAMDALEKLQIKSGRTIGIISHVDSLKERITTQIEVQRQSHGYSSISLK